MNIINIMLITLIWIYADMITNVITIQVLGKGNTISNSWVKNTIIRWSKMTEHVGIPQPRQTFLLSLGEIVGRVRGWWVGIAHLRTRTSGKVRSLPKPEFPYKIETPMLYLIASQGGLKKKSVESLVHHRNSEISTEKHQRQRQTWVPLPDLPP